MGEHMKVLVINGDCIQTNTSANLCHLAYIRGLVDSGHEVTLLSADGRDYKTDPSMEIPSEVKSHTYYGVSLYEKLSMRKNSQSNSEVPKVVPSDEGKSNHSSILRKVLAKAKTVVLSMYGIHGIYAKFVKQAQKFRSDEDFDYILSLSTPVTSHLLTYNLIKAGHIKGKHWIQIWEDPWYSDAYGFNGDRRIYEEEKRLLSLAERVCYVSPLTLRNQQRLYPECADKMYWQPLPYYYKAEETVAIDYQQNLYGYFGAYYPAARNLEPFYLAAKNNGVEINICGDPSSLFEETDRIHIYSRLPLKELKPIEDKTNILVFLCNRKGGQIPGKIYQYSATNKVILFVLDGTQEEKQVLRDYFEPFNRYIFCENTVDDISRAIQQIERGDFENVKNEPVEDFNPKETIRKVLEGR